MNFKNILLLFVLFLGACEFPTGDTSTATETKPTTTKGIISETTAIKADDRTCVPNVRVGKILASSNEDDIIAAYGKENVVRKDIGVGEGELAKGTIVFPGTKNELIVEWQQDFEYKKLKKIRIEKEESEWKSEEGIMVGTPLASLVTMNTKDFKFYGFEWDFGGVTNDWEGGKINKQLVLFLEPGKPEAIYPELLGDGLFSSSHPKAKAAELTVGGIIIHFGL